MDDVLGVRLVRVLGSVALELDDGRSVVPPSETQRRVLAVLAQWAHRSVSTARLADLVDLSPNAVRVAVGRLRRLAPGPWLSTTAAGYQLDVDTDAALMCAELDRAGADPAAMAQAVTWWGGEPFGDLGHEAWAAAETTRLIERHASAQEDLAGLLIDVGRGSEAVAALEQQVATHPWRDHSWGLLVRALASCGRQVEALRAYQRHREQLVIETGIEPSEELRRIEQRVAAGWDGRAPVAGVSSGNEAGEVAAPTWRSRSRVAALVIGRDRELDELANALATTQRAGTCVCVVGDAGIGKTLLVETFAARARATAAVVVSARCDEAAGAVLQPFRTLVDQLWHAAPDDAIVEHRLRNGDRLAAVAPHLAEPGVEFAPATEDDATARFLLFEAVADLVMSVARRVPVVLTVDDAHFAEATSLALLRHLARTVTAAPVLLVVATREPRADADLELRAVLADLVRAGGRRIELSPFGASDLGRLVQASLGDGEVAVDDEVLAPLSADTDGNPLLATHLVRHWIDAGVLRVEHGRAAMGADRASVSPVLRDLVWARLRSLDPIAPDVLTAAAVLGEPIAERALVDMSDLDRDDVERVLDLATRASILTEATEPGELPGSAGTLRFTHALIARAVVVDLAATKRRRLHDRAANALVALHGTEPAATAARIAHQFAHAHRPADALTWSMRAGDDAAALWAGVEAADWYRRALEHATTSRADDGIVADVLVRLGEAEQRAGIAGGLDRLVEAGERARSGNRPDCVVRAALATDRGFVRMGDFVPTQLGLVEAALTVVDPVDVDTRARLLALLGECLVGSPDAERREAAAREALTAADASADPTLVGRVAPAILYALWTPRSAALRREIGERAVASAMQTRDPHLRFMAHAARHNTQVALGDAAGAARSLAAMHEVVAGHPEPRLQWALGATDTYQATMAAVFPTAERLVDETFALGSAIGESDAFSLYAAQLYVMRTFAGRHGEMLPLVEQLIAAGPTPLPFRLAHGIACVAVGRTTTAVDLLAAGAADGFASVPHDLLWLTTVVGYAVLAIELGDRSVAGLLHPLLEPYADQVAYNGITSQGPVAAYVGKLASMLDRHDEADAHLHAALATTEAFGWEYHRATTLVALAELRHRRDGALDGVAAEYLATAAAICAERGIAGWAARVEQLSAR